MKTFRCATFALFACAWFLHCLRADAQNIQSPESSNFNRDCVLGDWPTPQLPCDTSLEIMRSIKVPASGSGKPCPIETKTVFGPNCTPPCSVFDFTFRGYSGKGIKDKFNDTKKLACLPALISEARTFCAALRDAWYWREKRGPLLYDDCVAKYFTSSWKGLAWETEALKLANANPKLRGAIFATDAKGALVYRGPVFANDDELANNKNTPALVFLDSSCKRVAAPTGGACSSAGSYQWIHTPLSLLWEDEVGLDSNQTISAFRLDPNKAASAYLWRASAKAPLVVWDPEGTGVVRDGSQLFGSWTFGGDRSASIAGHSAQVSSEWADGYEALKTLDADSDGALRGEELNGIALWFDNNRDGVSQVGEVRQLSDVNVTAIFTRYDRRDVQGNPYASKGYEVVRNGKAIVRPSVDWFTKGSSTAAELIGHRIFSESFAASAGSANGSSVPANPSKVDTDEMPSAVDSSSTAAGEPASEVWAWRLKEGTSVLGGASLGGYLVFGLSEDGRLKGHSMGVLPVKPGYQARVGFTTAELQGERISDTKIAFTVKNNGDSHTKLSSKATFLPDGTLEGSTMVELEGSGGLESFSYEWVAEPLTDNK